MKKKILIPVNIKLPKEMLELIQKRANEHADGNLSAWFRHTALNYVPKKVEKIISIKFPAA